MRNIKKNKTHKHTFIAYRYRSLDRRGRSDICRPRGHDGKIHCEDRTCNVCLLCEVEKIKKSVVFKKQIFNESVCVCPTVKYVSETRTTDTRMIQSLWTAQGGMEITSSYFFFCFLLLLLLL